LGGLGVEGWIDPAESAQVKLLTRMPQQGSSCPAPGVAKADPVADGTVRVLNAVEPLAMDALFFDLADHALDHAVLLRILGRDELLLQAIALDQRRVFVAGED
jgi:hypothetical protein